MLFVIYFILINCQLVINKTFNYQFKKIQQFRKQSMKKTQTMALSDQANIKVSFKNVLNIENDKIPQKSRSKSRTRGIKNKVQTDISRTTQNYNNQISKEYQQKYQQKYQKCQQNHQILNKKKQNQSNFNHNDANLSNLNTSNANSINVNTTNQDIKNHDRSIDRIRTQMRQQVNQRTSRSKSRRRKSNQNIPKQGAFNKFPSNPNGISLNNVRSQHYIQPLSMQNQQYNYKGSSQSEINRLKQKLNGIQRQYKQINKQIQLSCGPKILSSGSKSLSTYQSPLTRLNQLNNILDMTNISFNQNVSKLNKQALSRIQLIEQQNKKATNKSDQDNNCKLEQEMWKRLHEEYTINGKITPNVTNLMSNIQQKLKEVQDRLK